MPGNAVLGAGQRAVGSAGEGSDQGERVLEPQSTVLFVLLVLIFAGLIWWLVVTRRLAFRIVAGVMSFLVAGWFGVLAVNKYFSYYQTWGAAVADLANPNPNSGPSESAGSLLVGLKNSALDLHEVYLRLAQQQGYTIRVTIAGPRSHISRSVFIYLPPQYFLPQYKHYQFPVVELIHGQPGEPQDWINVVGVQVTLARMVNSGQAKPVVLVMPDANGGSTISLQCLNQVGGPQDLTYLAVDLPDAISRMIPNVLPQGVGWGVAGYSEGGFCAANMALRYRYRYGAAASISGYFVPIMNQLANPTRLVSPFGNNKALRLANTPLDEVRNLGAGVKLPLFWLGAGKGNKIDVANAQYFAQELLLHEATVPLDITPGGGHTMGTWHLEVPPMLAWMTNTLTNGAAEAAAVAAHQAAIARNHKSPSPGPHSSKTPGKSQPTKGPAPKPSG